MADVRKRHVLDPKRPMEVRRQAVVNLWDFLVKGGIADTTRTPSEIIDTGRTRELHRYERVQGVRAKGLPVLLVPPLGSQAACFDLRRGLSLAEELVGKGRPTYLVDYGPLKGADAKVGIEHFINDVLPPAIRKVSEDAGGRDVHLVGWCMGGLLSIGAASIYHDLPIRSVAMVASPFDTSKIPSLRAGASDRPGDRRQDRRHRAQGRGVGPRSPGQPRLQGHRAADVPQEAAHPVEPSRGPGVPRSDPGHRRDHEQHARLPGTSNAAGLPADGAAQRAGDREGPGAQPPDRPGRGSGPGDEHRRQTDVLVPVAAAHHVGGLVPNSPDVRLPIQPGGHLGVLTGTRAPATTWVDIHAFLGDHDRKRARSA